MIAETRGWEKDAITRTERLSRSTALNDSRIPHWASPLKGLSPSIFSRIQDQAPDTWTSGRTKKESKPQQVGTMLETAGRILNKNVSRCVISPKNRPLPLSYDFLSFSHVLVTFLLAVIKYMTRGNLKDGKGRLVSQRLLRLAWLVTLHLHSGSWT